MRCVHSTSQSEIEHSARLFNRNVARPGSPVLFWINGRSVGNFGESPLQYLIVAMISLSVLKSLWSNQFITIYGNDFMVKIFNEVLNFRPADGQVQAVNNDQKTIINHRLYYPNSFDTYSIKFEFHLWTFFMKCKLLTSYYHWWRTSTCQTYSGVFSGMINPSYLKILKWKANINSMPT